MPEEYAFWSNDFEENKYSAEDWAKMEAAGAVFLPAAGRRSGGYGNYATGVTSDLNPHTGYYSWVYNIEAWGFYWTSQRSATNPANGNYIIFGCNYKEDNGTYPLQSGLSIWSEKGRYGQTVRLAREAVFTVTTETEGVGGRYLAGIDGEAMLIAVVVYLLKTPVRIVRIFHRYHQSRFDITIDDRL